MGSEMCIRDRAWVDQPAPANLAPHRKIAALMATHDAASARLHFETTDTANDIAKTSPDSLTSLLGFFDRQPTGPTRPLRAASGHAGPAVGRGINAVTLLDHRHAIGAYAAYDCRGLCQDLLALARVAKYGYFLGKICRRTALEAPAQRASSVRNCGGIIFVDMEEAIADGDVFYGGFRRSV